MVSFCSLRGQQRRNTYLPSITEVAGVSWCGWDGWDDLDSDPQSFRGCLFGSAVLFSLLPNVLCESYLRKTGGQYR